MSRERMRGTNFGRIALLALLAVLGAGLALATTSSAVSKKQQKNTYGITSKVSKKGITKATAVKKPGKVTYKTFSTFVKATKIARFRDWGSKETSARAKVKICDVSGSKKKNCSNLKGTVTYDFIGKRKCKVKKGKKKKVSLYGRVSYLQEGDDGRGIAVQYGFPGTTADCPKF